MTEKNTSEEAPKPTRNGYFRSIFVCLWAFGIFIFYPTTAWAHANVLPLSTEQFVAAILIVPFMQLATLLSGAYALLPKNKDEPLWRTILSWAAHIIAWIIILYISIAFIWIAFLVFGMFAFQRAWQLFSFGKVYGNTSPTDPLIAKKAFKLKIAGIILFLITSGLLGVGAYFQSPPSYQKRMMIPDNDARSNLHNLYLGCKAYWAEHGSEQECDVSKVATQEYGFIQSSRVTIAGHGTEMNFTATAQHMDSTTQYTMDVNGSIE